MRRFLPGSTAKALSLLLLVLLSGCAQEPSPCDALPEEPDFTTCSQYMPSMLILDQQELSHLVIWSLTARNRVISDPTTEQVAKAFFNQLEPVTVPVSQEEYENSSFISGYIWMEFETTDGHYSISGDCPSKIFVHFVSASDCQECYGIYSVTAEALESFVSYIYEHLEPEFHTTNPS